MPDMSQMMGGGAPSPAGLPPGQGGTPGSAPLPQPGSPTGQSPAGGAKPDGSKLIMMLLTFLAGAGLGDVVKNLMRIVQPPGSKGGAAKDASKSPAQSIPPQMMQQMAQKQQASQGDPKLMMMIQQLLKTSGA